MDESVKYQTFLSEVRNLKTFKTKLEEIFITEFDTSFEHILIKKESEFMHSYTTRVRRIIEDLYTNEAFENVEMTKLFMVNTKEVYGKFYKPAYDLLSKEIKKETNMPTKFNFRRHCRYSEKTPYHDCDTNPTENTFLIVTGNDITYLSCVKCKRCYLSDSVRLYCNFCSISYYSCLEEDNQEHQPATWERYHCGAILNDQMKCIKCSAPFYLDLKQNLLVCKSCGFNTDPTSILWVCVLCKQDFTSNAKIYNPLEYKIIREAIKEAKLNKIPILPSQIPCCSEKVKELNFKYFTHKLECEGRIFQGEMQGRQICVCEKCKSVTNYEKFIWTCPVCKKRFRNYSKFANKDCNKEKEEDHSLGDKISSSKSLAYFTHEENYSSNAIPFEEVDNLAGRKTQDFNCDANKRKPKVSFNDDTYKSAKTNTDACNTSSNSSFQNKTKSSKVLQEISVISKSCNNIGTYHINRSNFSTINPETYKQTSLEDTRIIRPGDKRRTFQVKEKRIFKRAKTLNEEDDDIFQIEANPLNVNRNYIKKHTAVEKNPKINLENIKSASNESHSPYYSSRNTMQHEEDKEGHISIFDEEEYTTEKKDEEVLPHFDANSNKGKTYDSQLLIEAEGNNDFRLEKQIDIKNEDDDDESEVNPEFDEDEEVQLNEELTQNTKETRMLTMMQVQEINIDDYEILKQIGEGTYGKIYSVKDKTGQEYAMKKIIANTPQEIEDTRKECGIVNSLKHPNILIIKGICIKKLDTTTYGIYIIEEIGMGDWDREIKERKKTRKFYNEKELRIILKQLIDALSYMQEYNISHRDIKPQNILCFRNNIFKLSDFGEAKDLHNLEGMSTLRGTELFMSPKLNYSIKTNIKVDHNNFKSDMYSLGLCLLYAATLNYNAIHELREISLDYKKEIDFSSINKKMMGTLNTYLKMRYSKGFIEQMAKMLDLDEDTRYDFIEMKAEVTD